MPYEDATPDSGVTVTGSQEGTNLTTSAIGGHARIVAMHLTDAVSGNDCELARNQFFPITIFTN